MALTPVKPPLVPLRRAIAWIAASVLCVVLLACVGRFGYGFMLSRRAEDPTYQLFAMIQTGPEKEALKSHYLAELMELSTDQPVNLYAFDCTAARRRLLTSPLIKEATVTTYLPGTVYVDYTARKPVAYVRDYSNTAVDQEGVLIPSDPFFTPKRIPTIYLGLPARSQVWGRSIEGGKLSLAFAIRDLVQGALPIDSTAIKLIDVSLSDASSFGQREVILSLEERLLTYAQPIILRLDPANYVQAMANYVQLRPYLTEQLLLNPPTSQTLPVKVIDLRLPALAYIK